MRVRANRLLNDPVNISSDFSEMTNSVFNAAHVVSFDAQNHTGLLRWERVANKQRLSFNQYEIQHEPAQSWEFPDDYEHHFSLPFKIDFLENGAIRVRINARRDKFPDRQSLMITGELKPVAQLRVVEHEDHIEYTTDYSKVFVHFSPFNLEFYDLKGRLLTKTYNAKDTYCLLNNEPTPFSFVRRATDLKRSIAATFKLAPDEKIFGLGESFTRLNKRGQTVDLWTSDAHGTMSPRMYKPVPFLMSSKGYGLFIHSTAPMSLDIGQQYDEANIIYLGEDTLDAFIFTGNPKAILSAYTNLTGRAKLPPLWSFGLWMSRITYKSEAETREVANKLRAYRIPCDVIHLDTGWFETDWRCNYEFSHSRFNDPAQMIKDLRAMGYRISLWQLPYFTPQNPLYHEAIENGYVVLDENRDLPTEDAIIDFSNDQAVKWYQKLLAGLFNIGVGAIKADFGEAAPLHGQFASGKSGQFEHNLYPLRYNKAVSEITEAVTGDSIIWARSAWAGSQRYPIHWGGDAENTDCAMAASLRAGLSLGLCGFSFWSHDIGGFVQTSPEELYRRWMPFGMLTSHSRCHGLPPKEPWEYNEVFMRDFVAAVELKYALMPYIYSESLLSSQQGHPMLRTLFFEFPEDETTWFIEDQYLFGSHLLVAPLFEAHSNSRKIYLPHGEWFDYQSNERYLGGQWLDITAGNIPVVLLVKAGSVLPKTKIAQSTNEIDWNDLNYDVYLTQSNSAEGHLIDIGTGELGSLVYQDDGLYLNGESIIKARVIAHR